MYLMTCIDNQKNTCKFYAILGKEAYYGRIGSEPRKAFLREDPATVKRKKGKKGYVTTIPVSIPAKHSPYNLIKFFRLEEGKFVAYGYLNGFYRPLGMEFTDVQLDELFDRFGDRLANVKLRWLHRWNNQCVTP